MAVNNKPIVALATSPLKSALAVIRCSGEGIFEIAESMFSKKIAPLKEREILIGTLKENDKPIDQVVILAYPGPNSMTGEDVLEIMPHGSMVIVNQIIEAFLEKGCVYAQRGEFTERAFYNGKLDLVEAEAVNDLINAQSKEAKDLIFLSLNGTTSNLVQPIKKEIADLLSLIEVNIDYPEYNDIEEANKQRIVSSCKAIQDEISGLIKNGREGQLIKQGVKVALVGEPNVGKSSLLNALIKKDKALVSPIPGTTRDVVEGDLVIHGVPITFLDTAGIRGSEDQIEEMGVALSKKTIAEADVVVLLLDARNENLSEEEKRIEKLCGNKRLIEVYNKDDLIKEKKNGKLYVSALRKDVETLKEAIFNSLSLSQDSFSTPSLSNARQLGILRQINEDLLQASEDAKNDIPIDIVSVNLQNAYNLCRELLGEETTNDLTDEIFSRFCVGK